MNETLAEENPLSRDFDIKSLLKFALPTIIMMLLMGLYTIVDTIFVARFVGTNALSALNIVCPVINLIVGLGTMLATGGSAIVARKMGAGETVRASQDFTLIIGAGALFGVIITVLGTALIDNMIRGLGAGGILFPYCKEYLFILLLFTPASMLQVLFQTGRGLYIREDQLMIQKDEKTGLEFVINMDQPFSCNVPMTGELKGLLNEISGKRGIDLKEVPLQGGLTVNQDPKTGLRYLSIQGNEAKGMSVVATSKEDLEIIEKLADEFTKYSVSSQRSTAGLYALLEISGNLKREGEGMTFLTPNGITYIPYDGNTEKAWEIDIPSSDYGAARKYLAMGMEASNYQTWLSKFNSAKLLDVDAGLLSHYSMNSDRNGVIGAFCRTYSIEDAIAAFLSDVYQPSAMPGRYDYIPADSQAGVVIYEGKFAYSHHATDPACGKLMNAFDMVRIHRFGEMDEKAAEDTEAAKLPSFSAMSEFAVSDENVKMTIAGERMEKAEKEFSGESGDWQKELEYEKRSTVVKNTLRKAFLTAWNGIVENREGFLPAWERQIREGNALEKWRAGHMVQLTAEPPLEAICPEIVNMALESVEVHDGGLLHFRFLDGTVLEIDTEEE